jgi:hypothetical protein
VIARLHPWVRALSVARVALTRLRDDIPKEDRRRLRQVLAHAKGDPRRLTAEHKADLRRILGGIDLRRLGKDSALAGLPLPFAARWLGRRL